MAKTGGDPWRSSTPTPCPEQGQLEQAAQDPTGQPGRVQLGLHTPEDGDATNSPGSLCQWERKRR